MDWYAIIVHCYRTSSNGFGVPFHLGTMRGREGEGERGRERGIEGGRWGEGDRGRERGRKGGRGREGEREGDGERGRCMCDKSGLLDIAFLSLPYGTKMAYLNTVWND